MGPVKRRSWIVLGSALGALALAAALLLRPRPPEPFPLAELVPADAVVYAGFPDVRRLAEIPGLDDNGARHDPAPAHHTGAARRKLSGEEPGGAAAFQNTAVLFSFFKEKIIPAETIAICGDLIATAFQGGVMHQRFIGWTTTIVTSRFPDGFQVLTLQWGKSAGHRPRRNHTNVIE